MTKAPRFPRSRLLRRIAAPALLLAVAALPGCAAFWPTEMTTDERLDMFPVSNLPLERPVSIRWNKHQVPYITAQTDRDLFFALGLVHHHLRGGQLAVLKRISQGRLSEMAGPLANDIDQALQTLDYGYASKASVAAMPPRTRELMDAFVAGLNHHQDGAEQTPPEFGLLGIDPEPWKLEDLITIGRLAGTDVNWLSLFGMLNRRQQPGFQDEWQRALIAGGLAPSAVADAFKGDLNGVEKAVLDALMALSKSGSNSFAIAAQRSATGAPIIANDPHLGVTVPNFWLLAGIKSPSFHVVGMMIPGLPFMGLGRNQHLAWGGTNMRAASSELYNVASLPADQFSERDITLKTRLWWDDKVTARRSPLGPVMSDSPLINQGPGEVLALRWVGHDVTDEITAFLDASRANSVDAYRAALKPFGVPAQNMLVTSVDGDIAHILVARQPKRPYDVPTAPVSDPVSAAWEGFDDSTSLPMIKNPKSGYLVSGNNKPPHETRPLGWFFIGEDRVERMAQIAEETGVMTLADVMQLQTDVTVPRAGHLAAELLVVLAENGYVSTPLIERLRGWDGSYTVDSSAAPAFEALLTALASDLYADPETGDVSRVRGEWNQLTHFLLRDIRALSTEDQRALLDRALPKAEAQAAKFNVWGDQHRLVVGHILRNIPIIGSAFVVADHPIGGSRQSIMKTAHGLETDRHATRYGAQSRHVSDMSDPDANYFVLLGGQDGWFGSANYADQVPLWVEERYIQLPLTENAVIKSFPRSMTLTPSG